MSSTPSAVLISLVLTSLSSMAATFNGTITDSQGNPLPGAKVLLAKAGTATSASGNGTTNLSTSSPLPPPITTNIRPLVSRTLVNNRYNIELDGERLRIRFKGSDAMGRGSLHGTSSSPVPMAGFRTFAYTVSDTLLVTWNGNLRFRGLLDSLLTIHNVIIKIDTTAKTGDIPWNSKITTGTLIDARDGQSYRTVKIGKQTWMAENLNYKVDSSWWYDGSAANSALYGRLYSWSVAMGLPSTADSTLQKITSRVQGICPTGWHIPAIREWDTLATFVRVDTAAKALRCSNCNWAVDTSLINLGFSNYIVKGSDTFGFRMLGAGYYYPRTEKSQYLNALTAFWTSTESDSKNAFSANFSVDDERYYSETTNYKKNGASLRCIQD